MTKRRDFTPLDLPKPDAPDARTETRETFALVSGSSKALERAGELLEGSDGKTYLASFAVHVYTTGSGAIVGPPTFVTAAQTTDLTGVPESIARHAMTELTRAVMLRYGRTPPRKRDDLVSPETTI